MNASDSFFDVCVRGSGPVGMSLALALSRQGLRVALQEPSTRGPAPMGGAAGPAPTGGDVRTYALNAGSRALLESLKIWPALPAEARTSVYDMAVQGDGRSLLARAAPTLSFSAWQQGVDALAWIVDAAALEEELRAAVRYAPHVARVDHAVQAALLVAADGRDSTTREQLGVGWEVHSYGQRGLATRLVAERPHRGVARQWFRSPDVIALLPFDRPDAGHSYGLVWSVAEERVDALLALDDAAFAQALTAAIRSGSGDVDHASDVGSVGSVGGRSGPGAAEAADSPSRAITVGAQPIAGIGHLRVAGPRAAWPLRAGQADRWCGPGWVLVGDAAHQVHPLAGQGLNLGLADVAALAQVIAQREPSRAIGDERLLKRYVRARQWPTTAMTSMVDGLWHLYAQPSPVAQRLRNDGIALLDRLGPVKRFLTSRALQS